MAPRTRARATSGGLPSNLELLCTLGPSSLTGPVIARLAAAGVTSLRINMSHTGIAELPGIIRLIQRNTDVPICIDTEGAQLRTGTMGSGSKVVKGTRVRLVGGAVVGDRSIVPINPGTAIGRLKRSARVSVDFDSVVLRVDRVHGKVADTTVLTGGEIGSRKAVTAHPSPSLPTFSPKDLQALRIGRRLHVHQYALSFCESREAVEQLRRRVLPTDTIMAKIESRAGVRNLVEIARNADRLIIDRGDLSREVRLEAIPALQKAIIRRANSLGVPVYVATNLLESMITRRTPTRAEVNDVINTLLDGADGLVLAAETAIGEHPVESARMIVGLMREFERSVEGNRPDELLGPHPLAHPR
ncbi:MAG: pyruvate kinase [Thermoplasmata archaeon]|nr:pyruvate kinase [Thermoplasmata archaeon]